MGLNIFFDKAKKVLDTDKDAVLARALGIAPQKLDRARKEAWIKTEVLAKLAEITGDDIEVIVLAREADRTEDLQTKALLENSVYRMLSRVKQVGGILGIGALAMSVSLMTAEDTRNASTIDAKFGASDLYYRKLWMQLIDFIRSRKLGFAISST